MSEGLINNSNNSIFHYTKLSTALECILPTRKLKFNSLLKTNDPKEYKTYRFVGIKNSFDELSEDELGSEGLGLGKMLIHFLHRDNIISYLLRENGYSGLS